MAVTDKMSKEIEVVLVNIWVKIKFDLNFLGHLGKSRPWDWKTRELLHFFAVGGGGRRPLTGISPKKTKAQLGPL